MTISYFDEAHPQEARRKQLDKVCVTSLGVNVHALSLPFFAAPAPSPTGITLCAPVRPVAVSMESMRLSRLPPRPDLLTPRARW